MGKSFTKVRTTIKQNALIVRTALRSSLAFFLHGNPQYADEIKEALERLIKALKNNEYDTEDILHIEVSKAFSKVFEDKPLYVKAAFTDLVDTMFSLMESKVEMDEDKLLSKEEKEAWVLILEGMEEICEMVLKEEASS